MIFGSTARGEENSESDLDVCVLVEHGKDALKRLPRHKESAYLFCHQENGRYTGERFRDLKVSWTALMKEAGITNLRFHDLRHYPAFRIMPSSA
ncbi:MAG: nucleotidyltransferase domain-containing protein [Planctomycetes bacterium]|nr:nucleotidyltransferase domain-containing protein [Planctomycetota bacterium]